MKFCDSGQSIFDNYLLLEITRLHDIVNFEYIYKIVNTKYNFNNNRCVLNKNLN